ncbi:MAG: LysR family transcriptional regulator [Ktedonobacterales bacterium]|nr:LysR family transcriptional regulator [Ktedonobacterales bacterium]
MHKQANLSFLTEEIQLFWMVTELGSYKKAASHYNVSPLTIARNIHKLEQQFGQNVQLLNHPPFKPFVITEAGKALKEHLKKLMSTNTDIHRHINDINNGLRGSLTIGAFASATPIFIPNLVHGLNTISPNIEISIHERGTSAIFDMIEKDEIDLGIARLPAIAANGRKSPFIIRELYEERGLAVFHKSHQFALKQDDIRLEELAEEPLLLLRETSGVLNQQFISYLTQQQIPFKIIAEGSEIFTLLLMVAQNIGVTIIPDRGWTLYPDLHKFLRYRKIAGDPIRLKTGIVRKKARYHSQAMMTAETIIEETEIQFRKKSQFP